MRQKLFWVEIEKSMFGGSPTNVVDPTVLASWTCVCYALGVHYVLWSWNFGCYWVRIPFSSFHWFARKETWHGALISWKIQGLSEKCLTTTGQRLSSKTEIYLSVFMLPSIANANDLRRVVLDIWTDLGLHYIRSLYDSIPRRIRCVLSK
jgi:hypothetical protein